MPVHAPPAHHFAEHRTDSNVANGTPSCVMMATEDDVRRAPQAREAQREIQRAGEERGDRQRAHLPRMHAQERREHGTTMQRSAGT